MFSKIDRNDLSEVYVIIDVLGTSEESKDTKYGLW